MAKFMDLTGQTFSSLVVLSRASSAWRKSGRQGASRWHCRCKCGKETIVSKPNLQSGHTRSCGCLLMNIMATKFKTHGRTESHAYRTWCGIKARCYNPSTSNYYLYGAKGVTVCDRWLKSFENFYQDMSDPPTSKHSIDRKENSLGYFPENCKWSTLIEQANNKGNNVKVTFSGKTQTVAEWARELNLPEYSLRWRLKNWPSIEKCFCTPIRQSIRR
jgi:hypothetical protein